MRKILFWPYQLYAWLVFIPLACVLSLLAGWLAVMTAIAISPRAGSRYVATRWARLIAWLAPMRVELVGGGNLDPGETYVVVSNHLSQFDILALYGWLDLDLKWVIKKELRKLPGIGIGCEKVGHIFVDRQNPEAARRSVNEALDRLGNGVGILFFAEGTRSLDGRLLPFKKGAFRIAIDQQLPVLPVTVIGTEHILPAKSLRLFPGRARVVIHPPIAPDDPPFSELRELMDETRRRIASALPESYRASG